MLTDVCAKTLARNGVHFHPCDVKLARASMVVNVHRGITELHTNEVRTNLVTRDA